MDFDKIFEIMDETFPDSEMRSYDGQKSCSITLNIIFILSETMRALLSAFWLIGTWIAACFLSIW